MYNRDLLYKSKYNTLHLRISVNLIPRDEHFSKNTIT